MVDIVVTKSYSQTLLKHLVLVLVSWITLMLLHHFFQVLRSFLETIQTTLREFIDAIVFGKDWEQFWKKPIYKVIARLDDLVSEYSK